MLKTRGTKVIYGLKRHGSNKPSDKRIEIACWHVNHLHCHVAHFVHNFASCQNFYGSPYFVQTRSNACIKHMKINHFCMLYAMAQISSPSDLVCEKPSLSVHTFPNCVSWHIFAIFALCDIKRLQVICHFYTIFHPPRSG